MNYRKYVYRRLDLLVMKASEMLAEGKELTPTFRAAKEESDNLLQQAKNLYSDAKRDKKDIPMSPEWCSIVEKAESFRKQSEKLLRDSVRPYLGPQSVNVDVLVGYCPQTIPYYQQMIKELQKTFKKAKIKDINLGQVKKSRCVQGFTLISWNGEASFIDVSDDYPSYELDLKNGKDYYVSEECEYHW